MIEPRVDVEFTEHVCKLIRADARLSYHELRIVGLLVVGKSNKEIAGYLSTTEAAVKVHTHNIFLKLHVDSRYKLLVAFYGAQDSL